MGSGAALTPHSGRTRRILEHSSWGTTGVLLVVPGKTQSWTGGE